MPFVFNSSSNSFKTSFLIHTYPLILDKSRIWFSYIILICDIILLHICWKDGAVSHRKLRRLKTRSASRKDSQVIERKHKLGLFSHTSFQYLSLKQRRQKRLLRIPFHKMYEHQITESRFHMSVFPWLCLELCLQNSIDQEVRIASSWLNLVKYSEIMR